MKYCTYCGQEINDDADYCPNCGCKIEDRQTGNNIVINNENEKNKSGFSKIKIAILVIMILGTIVNAYYSYVNYGHCWSLIWCIPMTISYYYKVKKGEKISASFKVCTLILVSILSGILMLCDNDKK